MKRPFIWFLAALAAGITAEIYGHEAAAVIAISVMAVAALIKYRIPEPIYMPLIAVIGILLCSNALSPKDSFVRMLSENEVGVMGTVRNSHLSDKGNTVITLDTERIIYDNRAYTTDLKLSVINNGMINVTAGDIVEFKGTLSEFKKPTNPYQKNFDMYMKSQGYDYSFFADSLRFAGARRNEPIYVIERMREKVNSFYDMNMDTDEAGVAKALTTGFKNDISDVTRENFANLGISHVLAISGLHVSLIALMLYKIMAVSGIRKRFILPVTGVFVVLYVLFTGCSPSAVRAALMCITTYCAFMLFRHSDRFNTIAFSAFLMLIINPLNIINLSFQLSYTGIFGVAFAEKIVGDMKKAGKLKKTVVFSITVWVFTTPIVMYYFGGVSLISPLSNIILVPYLGLVTAVLFATGIISLFVNIPFAVLPAEIMLKVYNGFVNLTFGKFDFYLNTAKPSFIVTAALYAFIIFCIAYRKKKKLLLTASTVFAVSFATVTVTKLNAPLQLVFFDVGQGDGAAVYTEGKFLAVVDGGHAANAENSVIPYVEAKRRQADILFITHLDDDHCGGAIEMIKRNMVKQVVVSDAVHNDRLEEVVYEAGRNGIPIFYAAEGDRIIAENINIDVLYPYSGLYGSENSTSLVFNLQSDGFSALFTGDINSDDELYLMNKNISCDIIKVAHHGSNTSSNRNFLENTGADVAVIQAAEKNSYSFPHEDVVRRLEQLGMDIYITGNDGAVTVTVSDGEYKIKTFGNQK